MASIRKRTLPSGKVAWLSGYVDGGGARRFKQFATRKEADAFLLRARTEVAAGSHVPDRAASTVEEAFGLLIATLEAEAAARSTVENYRTYWGGHVRPYLGARLLPRLHPADVSDWLRQLKAEGRTDDTCRRARIVLGAVFDEAIRQRLAYTNPVRSLRSRRKTRRAEIREAEETIAIPERETVRAMLAAAAETGGGWLYATKPKTAGGGVIAVARTPGVHPIREARAFAAAHPGLEVELFRPAHWLRPFLATMAFAGLRIGETRGLHWHRAKGAEIGVREAVDRFNVLDKVKTVAALRTIPIGPLLAAILANWKAASGRDEGLVFPSRDKDSGRGDRPPRGEAGSKGKPTPLAYPNIVNRQLGPLQLVLGITAADGSPRWTPHSFRHFAVSLWIDEGASLKQVADWAGHESPEFTQRVYGHLFEKGRTDRRAITAGELSVLGAPEAATPTQHGNDNTFENRAATML